MSFPTDTYLQFIRNAQSWVSLEFESLYAQLTGWLSKQHKADGSHGAITADSIALTTNSQTGATGVVTAGGAGTFGGAVTASSGTTDQCVLGAQFPVPSNLIGGGLLMGGTSHGWYALVEDATSPGNGNTREVRWYDLANSSSYIMRWLYDVSNSRYLIGVDTAQLLAIGENSNGKRIAYVAAATINLSGGTDLSTFVEGTWTPTIKFGGGNTGITYSQHTGFYQRLGSQVHISGVIVMTSKGSSTGAATIEGLPYTCGVASGFSLGYYSVYTATNPGGYVQQGLTNILLSQNGASASNADDTMFGNATVLVFSAIYSV